MDGRVVQVIPVGRSLDEEGVSPLFCAAAWDFVGPIVVPYVVTNGVGSVQFNSIPLTDWVVGWT